MKVFNNISEFAEAKPTAITTGTFDGVHLGHKKILDRLKSEAKSIDGESVLVTFHPHPRSVLFPNEKPVELLSPIDEKVELLRNMGIDNLIIHPFTKSFSKLSARQYVKDLLCEKLNLSRLVIGYDHQFGKNREGSLEQLKEFAPEMGFDVTEIPAQDIDDVKVSSTKIREAIKAGDVRLANSYLTYPYFLQGVVVKGAGRGKGLGFPTANIQIKSEEKLIPGHGVYAVIAFVDGKQVQGMMNIGVNPTFGENARSLEVNLLNFDRDIYEQSIRVEFVERLRDEMTFGSAEGLVRQMNLDRELAKTIFSK